MEWKIGEIKQVNGEWYQCIEDTERVICNNCCFYNGGFKLCTYKSMGHCFAEYRSDSKSICFKKLEKVGEPYEYDGYIFQKYHTFEVPIFTENYATIREFGNNSKISIEIKQNKEDMEEKKLNLKPFDIQKAREGKPVCTRDGRKARIICFDRKVDTSIVALIEHVDGSEILQCYFDNGKCCHNETSDYELMMLPEKKEGWVNVYMEETNNNERLTEQVIYKTRKDAFDNACPRGYKATVKIEWEE